MMYVLLVVFFSVVCASWLPQSIGVETRGGVMTRVASRLEMIPFRRRIVLTNVNVEKKDIVARIFAGERAFVRDNIRICELVLFGVPPSSSSRKWEIEVTVSIDEQGVAKADADIFGLGINAASCVFDLPPRNDDEDSNFEQEAIFEVRDEDALKTLRLHENDGVDLVPINLVEWVENRLEFTNYDGSSGVLQPTHAVNDEL